MLSFDLTDSKLMSNTPSNKLLIRTPNIGGKLKDPRYVVVHYTASTNFKSTCDWLCDKRARASAHVVVARTGELAALVPFSRVAWHAGPSSWRGTNGLNNCSIGIELLNAGPVRKIGDGFRAVVGNQIVHDVFEGKHKSGLFAYEHWQKYTDPQIQALDTLLGQLFADFPTLIEIVGHDDIAPNRKSDPGPAFDEIMLSLKAKHDRWAKD